MIPYAVKSIDLTIPETTQLAGPGTNVTSWTILQYPGGNACIIRNGLTGQDIPASLGLQWEYDPCTTKGESEGVYWVQPAAGAGIAVVVLFFGGGGAS